MNKEYPDLPDIEIKQLLGFKVSLQMLADTDRTDPYRRTGEKKVTDFQSHKAADISNDIVYPEQHIGSMPLLYRFPVYIQVEMKRAAEQPMLVQNSYVGKMIETVQ